MVRVSNPSVITFQNNMDKHRQRMTIAEFLGWRLEPIGPPANSEVGIMCRNLYGITENTKIWKRPAGVTRTSPPFYCNDLDAMRDAWRSLNYNQQAVFGHYLSVVVFGKGLADGFVFGEHDLARLANATAEELAKAFLMTIGKWEEEPDEQG